MRPNPWFRSDGRRSTSTLESEAAPSDPLSMLTLCVDQLQGEVARVRHQRTELSNLLSQVASSLPNLDQLCRELLALSGELGLTCGLLERYAQWFSEPPARKRTTAPPEDDPAT